MAKKILLTKDEIAKFEHFLRQLGLNPNSIDKSFENKSTLNRYSKIVSKR